MYDVCMDANNMESDRCSAIETYATACAENGIKISWRKTNLCRKDNNSNLINSSNNSLMGPIFIDSSTMSKWNAVY